MLRPVLAAIALLGFVLPPVAATESPANLVATDPDLANELRNTGFGDRLRLVADGLPGGSVELERVPVFTEDAKIVLHTAEGDRVSPPPSTAYFRGWIDDRASGGLVTLSVNQTGDLQGIVNGSAGRALLLGGPAHGISSGLEVRAISPVSPSGGFDCRNGDLRDPRPEAAFDKLVADLRPPAGEPALGGASFTARIAIETDTEYLGKFGGSVAAATDYTAGLFNFTSGLYDSEVDTTHLISHLSLWETPDPWSQTSPNCILYEYGRYWNDNNSGIDRTTSHFLSGKATNAGIAWVGVLCTGAFSFDIDDFGGGCPALVPRTDN